MRYFDNPNKTELQTYLKASSGAFVGDLIQYIQDQEKFVIASAHDSSVTPLASILIRDEEWEATQVDYASFIAVEVLSDDDGNAYTKIRFRNGGEGFGDYMGQKACDGIACTLEEFLDYLKPFVITREERYAICNQRV